MNRRSPQVHRLRPLLLTWAALVILTLSPPSSAFTHIVQPGDTLASISEAFYGKIQRENLLVVANALEAQGGTRIAPGMRLEVPAVTYTRIAAGDTWKSLALRLLGGEHRAHALASANGSKAWLPPEAEAEIVVPYNLRFVATGDETVVGLAYRFLGDRKLAWMLDQYNQREGRRFERGDVLLIPVVDIELTEAGKAAAKHSEALIRLQAEGETRALQLRVQKELASVADDVRNGRYVAAVARANRFLGEGALTAKQRSQTYRELLEAYVALGAEGLAREACALWRAGPEPAPLDPNRYSPKIIAVCESAAP